MVLFPNLTSSFSSNKNIDHFFKNNDISFKAESDKGEEMKDEGDSKISFSFFNKIMRFLKVTSGTHNLTRLF